MYLSPLSKRSRSFCTVKTDLTIFSKDETHQSKPSGLSFAGLYVLPTEEVVDYKSHKPHIISQSILNNPEQLHRFFMKMQGNPWNSLYLIPVPPKRDASAPKEEELSRDKQNSIVPVQDQKNEVALATYPRDLLV
jgi:hypothetical protein